MEPTKISVVISTFNRCAHLKDAIESLTEQNFPSSRFEVIIVDNNSTDETWELLSTYSHSSSVTIKYFREKHQGLSYARNRGVEEAEGNIVAFLDDDATADKNWLNALMEIYQKFPDAGVVGGRIKPVWLSKKPAWLTPNLEMSFGVLNYGNEIQELTFPKTPFGGNFSIKRDLFFSIGGFCEKLGRKGLRLSSSEEVYYCSLVEQQQKKVYYTPNAVVHHKILPERLNRRYIIKRAYYQGISNAVIAKELKNEQSLATAKLLNNLKDRIKDSIRHLLSGKHMLLTQDLFSICFICGKLKEVVLPASKKTMKKKEVKINYIFTRMAHHSLHSGYDQLVKYIDDSRVVEPNYLHRFLSLLPERVLAQLRRTAGSWYNSHALKKELQNIFDFIFKSNRIYHFLYGEDGFHYSGYLNQRKTNKIIATFHMPPAKFLKITEGTQHLKKLDAVIILAPNQESLFKNIVKPEKVHLIPHGVDTKFFHPVRDIKKHEKKCLFVGTHLRNFKMLRQVIEEINRKDPEVSFTIVTFKDFFNHFEGLRNVKLCSSVSEEQLVDFYNTSELLLLPISDCTACNTVLEAMACGLPIVSTQVGGISMYVNEKSAALVNPGDISRMVERTLEIVNNQQLKLSMSREARKKAEEFDWTIIAKKTQEIYAHLLQNN